MAVERRFGQKQTIEFDVSGVLTKYGKDFNDVVRAYVTLKANEDDTDSNAAFAKNSDDHPDQVSFALSGSNTVVTAIVLGTDFANNSPKKIAPAIDYKMGVGLILAGEDQNTTFEPDSYSSDEILRFTKHRVDTLG